MREKISIYDFRFHICSYGRYRVTYTSPITGKEWGTIITDMTLIDATKNCESPKIKDLEKLKGLCKCK